MNKDILLGILIGFILTLVLAGVGGILLYPRLIQMFGSQSINQPTGNSYQQGNPNSNYGAPSSGQQQEFNSGTNGTLFGCAELKLVGTETVKSGVPFTIQNMDSKSHKIRISLSEYDFAAGEKKTITINGNGAYQVPCDDKFLGELNVAK